MAARVKVILLERIPRLGELGEEVAVTAGYARNWLFRQKQALPATAASRKEFELIRKDLESQQQQRLEASQTEAEQWQDLQLRIEVQAGPSGKMYGSISTRDVVMALKERGMEVENRQILLPYALRELGEHRFVVQLHPQVRVEVGLLIAATGSSDTAAAEEHGLYDEDDDSPHAAPDTLAAASEDAEV